MHTGGVVVYKCWDKVFFEKILQSNMYGRIQFKCQIFSTIVTISMTQLEKQKQKDKNQKASFETSFLIFI